MVSTRAFTLIGFVGNVVPGGRCRLVGLLFFAARGRIPLERPGWPIVRPATGGRADDLARANDAQGIDVRAPVTVFVP